MKRKRILLITFIAAWVAFWSWTFLRDLRMTRQRDQEVAEAMADLEAELAELKLQVDQLDQKSREARHGGKQFANPAPNEDVERAMQFDRLGRPVPLLRN